MSYMFQVLDESLRSGLALGSSGASAAAGALGGLLACGPSLFNASDPRSFGRAANFTQVVSLASAAQM